MTKNEKKEKNTIQYFISSLCNFWRNSKEIRKRAIRKLEINLRLNVWQNGEGQQNEIGENRKRDKTKLKLRLPRQKKGWNNERFRSADAIDVCRHLSKIDGVYDKNTSRWKINKIVYKHGFLSLKKICKIISK